jgi:hypothetical protein
LSSNECREKNQWEKECELHQLCESTKKIWPTFMSDKNQRQSARGEDQKQPTSENQDPQQKHRMSNPKIDILGFGNTRAYIRKEIVKSHFSDYAK